MNPAVQHISENFNLFGFGTQEAALLQSIKEIVENSIDACKNLSTTSPTSDKMKIRATITQSEHNQQFIILEVEDEGIGMPDPETLLKCFKTNKDSESESTVGMIGRFGVGLSTCLIYSLINTNIPMRLVTKCNGVIHATIADFSLDEQGNPKSLQSCAVTANGISSGTKIRLHLPLDLTIRVITFNKLCTILSTYIKRVNIIPASCYEIDFKIQMDIYPNFTLSLPPSSLISNYPTILLPNNNNNNSSSSVNDVMIHQQHQQQLDQCTEQLKARLDHCLRMDGFSAKDTVYHVETMHGSSNTSTTMGRYEVGIFLSIIEKTEVITSTTMTDNEYHDNDINPTIASTTTTTTNTTLLLANSFMLPLQIWRYVNHIPLLDSDDDALSCGLTAAVRGMNWNRFEYKLKLSIDVPASAGNANTTVNAPILQERSPQWELHSKRMELSDLFRNNNYQLIIGIDIQGTKIPFANMRKTCLGNEDKALIKQIQLGIQNACQKLQNSPDSAIQGLFMTTKQYKENQMRYKYIPSIASSISKIFAFQNDDNKAWAQDKLSTDEEELAQDQMRVIVERKLRDILRSDDDVVYMDI